MKFLTRFVGAEPGHHCEECGTDRLPVDAELCWECDLPAPEVNAYQADETGRPRLRVVPSSPPPADPVPAGFEPVDETLWSGHRFVLLRHQDTGGHRITVDGVEVWETDDSDTEAAAAEMARRMGSVDLDDDQGEALDPADLGPADLDVDVDETLERIDRRPILDDWQRSPRAALDRAGERLADIRYRALYRTAHPLQLVRVLGGLWVAGAWWLVVRWVLFTFHADETAKRVRDKSLKESGGARDKTDDKAGLSWDETHRQAIYRRLGSQLAAAAAVAVAWTAGAVWSWYQGNPWSWAWWAPGGRLTAALAAVAVIGPMLVGRIIRPADEGPVLKTPINIHRVPDLRRNPGLILDGFENLGGSTTSQAYKRQRERGVPACTFREDIRATETGTGLVCKVRTPEPADVMLNPSKHPGPTMAKALGRPADLVKLSYHPDDEADVVTVFVSRRALKDMAPGDWPLLQQGTANYFEPITIGIDEYGELVKVVLTVKHMLVGGTTGSGKSAAIRTLLCGVMLDPRVRLFAYFKGGPDGKPFESVAHRLRMGNDPADLAAMAEDLAGVVATAKRRMDFQEAHSELFPTGAVTDENCNAVAADPGLAAELDEHLLFPIVVMVDECRFPLMDETISEQLVWLALQARSVGITLIMATQRPDATTVPTKIRGQFEIRYCLRIDDANGRDAVLGGGVTDAGLKQFRALRQGMGFIIDSDQAHRGAFKIKSHFVPLLPQAAKVLTRAANARHARGLLSGVAAGEIAPDPSTDTILDHIAALPHWGDRIHGDHLAQLLAAQFAQYAEGDLADRTKRVLGLLRDHGLKPRQIELVVANGYDLPDAGQRKNRMGLHRPGFDNVYAEMLAGREADTNPRQVDNQADTNPDVWADNWADTDPKRTPDTDPSDEVSTDEKRGQ